LSGLGPTRYSRAGPCAGRPPLFSYALPTPRPTTLLILRSPREGLPDDYLLLSFLSRPPSLSRSVSPSLVQSPPTLPSVRPPSSARPPALPSLLSGRAWCFSESRLFPTRLPADKLLPFPAVPPVSRPLHEDTPPSSSSVRPPCAETRVQVISTRTSVSQWKDGLGAKEGRRREGKKRWRGPWLESRVGRIAPSRRAAPHTPRLGPMWARHWQTLPLGTPTRRASNPQHSDARQTYLPARGARRCGIGGAAHASRTKPKLPSRRGAWRSGTGPTGLSHWSVPSCPVPADHFLLRFYPPAGP
jgi:hypothetical protein